ncbi:ATPase, T2SS/T4P/T4SS family [Pyxidicoccus sp. 3LG]
MLTTPELVDPVARALIERSGAAEGGRRPGRIEGSTGHFRVWAQPGGLGAQAYAWRRDREQEARMPSPSEAGFDASVSDWLERRYLEYQDAHSRLLVVAAERIEDTRGTVDLLLGLMDDPNLNGISAEEGGLSVRAPWLSQIVCEGDLTLGGALRAALRQDPDVVVVRGASAFDHFTLLAQTAFTGHAVISTLAAPSAEAAHERVLALSAPIGATPAFDVLFVREQREDGRVRLSGELRAGA